jgi:hypothetical protein
MSWTVAQWSQIVTAFMMVSAVLGVLFRGGKVIGRVGEWFYKLIKATEENTQTMKTVTQDVRNLSVRLSAVETQLGITNMVPTVAVIEHHDTPHTRQGQ